MRLFRIISSLLVIILLCTILPISVLAQDETTTTTTTTPTPEINFTITTDYPKIEILSGAQVSFRVTLNYSNTTEGARPREFDLITILPPNWTGYVSSSAGPQIASINLDPVSMYGTIVTVYATPSYYLPPGPGEYKITLQATSGDIKGSIDLTAVVTAQYALSMVPAGSTPVYSTTATAGKVKIYPVTIQNTGSAAIDSISLSSSAPSDWVIEFPMDKIDSIAASSQQTLDVKIKPASKAISGDYMITLTASGQKATAQDLQVRVTVVTSSIWGWVGIVVIIIVIAGLAYVFMRFSRR
jgi:uncharacterized membrane protein